MPRFAVTLFVSAALLFCVEPMVAKMILPRLGGAPAVWILCMLFFQGALLAGYAYAHATTAWLGVRRQAMAHVGILLLPLVVLPIHFGGEAARALERGDHLVLRFLWLLVVGAGLPFFVVSTSGPLVQMWFSRTARPGAEDPYFLYGASNLGSMLALAAYPAILEPSLGLEAQARLWRWGYVGLIALVATCAVSVLRHSPLLDARSIPAAGGGDRVLWTARARWVALAFVPSSLLLGVTSHVTTDIAAMPLFWVIPLAVYLLTFILVFARRPPIPPAVMTRLLPLAVTASVITILTESATPGWLLVVVHVATLFVASMVCHGELARLRPKAARLTEFYLWVSVGGVLGGVFNGLVAPAIFRGVVEYPLALVLACLCRPRAERAPEDAGWGRDALAALAVGAFAAVLLVAGRRATLEPGGVLFKVLIGAPLLVNYGFLGRPRRFALGVAATLLVSPLYPGASGRTIAAYRNFFGVVRVTHDAGEHFVQLAHGNTIHGRQSLDPAQRGVPLLYYHPTGPIGQVFEVLAQRTPAVPARVGAIGLGVGTLACYARPGQTWTFYEINPVVVSLAEDPRYFTYLADHFHDAGALSIVVGDARLELRDAPDGGYGLLVLDAFSSDAIPAHLLTREALGLYLAKLEPTGIIAAHVSNRYLDLAPVFGRLAEDAGLVALVRTDLDVSPELAREGKRESEWVVLAHRAEDLGTMAADPRWQTIQSGGAPVWTDDFSNLLRVYRW